MPHGQSPIPPTALWLGAAGMLPFIALASGLQALPAPYRPVLLAWLAGYGAVVLSFVGAVHWGVAITHPRMPPHDQATVLGWSIVPALVAAASLLVGDRTGLLLLATGFVVQHGADTLLAQRFGLPGWYLRLRRGLGAVAVICLLAGAASIGLGGR